MVLFQIKSVLAKRKPVMDRSILNHIGNTPLVKLKLNTKPTILAKLEYLNPGGSIKDRPASYMINAAEKSGDLKPGGTIIEASSGNQGIALAMIGACKGYNVIITVPEGTSEEKIATLRSYGAKVHVCPSVDNVDDPDSHYSKAKQLLVSIPNSFMPNQFHNPANPKAHYCTTGPEIWRQTEGKVTHFFSGMGSCGTISGVGKYLKSQNPDIKIIGVDAEGSKLSSKEPHKHTTEGIGVDIVSDILNKSVINDIVPIKDEDALNTTREFAKKYGLLIGLSSGAVMHVALNYAKNLTKKDVMVVIFADSGRAYLSKTNIVQRNAVL